MQQLTAAEVRLLADTATPSHPTRVVRCEAGGVPSLERVRELLDARLHLTPRLRRSVVGVPLGLGFPFWADDPRFSIDQHVHDREVDGSHDDTVAALHAQPIDPRGPLWDVTVVRRPDGSGTLIGRCHPAMLDPLTGEGPLDLMLSPTAGIPSVTAPDWQPADLPGPHQTLTAGLVSSGLAYARAALRAPRHGLPRLDELPAAGLIPGGRRVEDSVDAVTSLIANLVRDDPDRVFVPPTPFGGPPTANRRTAWVSLDRDDVDDASATAGGGAAGVVLAALAGVLREWLLDRDALTDFDLIAATPVEAVGEPSSALVAVPTGVRDPVERARVAARRWAAVGSPVPRVRPVLEPPPVRPNLVLVTDPLARPRSYVDGAEVTSCLLLPVTAATAGLAVSVEVRASRVEVGLTACREMIPDLADLGKALAAEVAARAA